MRGPNSAEVDFRNYGQVPGVDHFLIANADTVMSHPNSELIEQVFADTEVTRELADNESLFDITKARKILGWEPQHSWRDHV